MENTTEVQTMPACDVTRISGIEDGKRIESRLLEERIQKIIAEGARNLHIEANGQHGLGGRLGFRAARPSTCASPGLPGQRIGFHGQPRHHHRGRRPRPDDVGWLNGGATIIVRGNAGNGVCNAMAQGRVAIGGNIGARGMTMTKHNPRFSAPELRVLGGVGDYFAEFMAGGTAVICGHDAQDPTNVLGYRLCVGMVGGRVFVRGQHQGFSQGDAKLVPIDDTMWAWLETHLATFLADINKADLLPALAVREDWQCITARGPYEKTGASRKLSAPSAATCGTRNWAVAVLWATLRPSTAAPFRSS